MPISQQCQIQLTARGPKGAWTHIQIPFDAANTFGRRGLIPVAGTINGFVFRSSLTPEGEGRYSLVVNKVMLAGAKAAAGDTVFLTLALDEAQRTVSVPIELEAVLRAQLAAATAFAALSYSHRKEYADWVGGANKQDTRARRADKAVGMILEGRPAR